MWGLRSVAATAHFFFLAAAFFFGAAFLAAFFTTFLAPAFLALATRARLLGRLLPRLPMVRFPFFVFLSPFPIARVFRGLIKSTVHRSVGVRRRDVLSTERCS